MNQLKYIFFDCMETIIDMFELPSNSDYANWAYRNSGVESYWQGFEDFLGQYEESKKYIESVMAKNEEYDMYRRFDHIVNRNDRISDDLKASVIERLNSTYWNTYKSKCYISKDVYESLIHLSHEYRLAVVSNFKVRDGIEELLEQHKVKHLFDFLVTSIHVGWRKPDPRIYQYALRLSGASPEEVVFIGDDYVNDFAAPDQLGMKSLFLSKAGQIIEGKTVNSFTEIQDKLAGMN